MEHMIASWGKVNVTLRVTGRRSDGYHALHSAFFRVGPLETLRLRVRHGQDMGDTLFLRSEVPVVGENLVLRALALLRRHNGGLPFFEVELSKQIPPGSGLGAGSGNAAAILSWGRRQGLGVPEDGAVVALGADVPFLASACSAGCGEGVGEQLTFFSPPALQVALVVPRWSCATGPAFAALDRETSREWSSLEDARQESDGLLRALASGASVGLLPNDFCPALCAEHGEYEEFFAHMRRQGALGWGISGSGSSAFALFPRAKFVSLPDFSWARMGTLLEV